MTSKAVGTALELRVARALARGGYSVERNVILKDRFGNRSEIDVVYRGPLWLRTYVECKAYHGSGSSVGLEEVAKFKEVLSLNGISVSRGLFITTSTFVPRAKTTGVRTLDGEALAAWERSLARRGLLRKGALGLALLFPVLVGAAALGGGEPAVLDCAREGWEEGRRQQRGAWLPLRGAQRAGAVGALAHALGFQTGAVVERLLQWWAR
jgi:hypothetical protein